MTDTITKPQVPARAIASIMFACCSLFLFVVYGRVHWLPSRFSKYGEDIFHRMLSETGSMRDELDVGYRVLAVISLVWCIWAWRTEARMPAFIATVFAILAVFCAVFIVI